MKYARIAGTGSFLTEKVLTNHQLEEMVDTSDEWILERTGISKRHIAEDDFRAEDASARARHCCHQQQPRHD